MANRAFVHTYACVMCYATHFRKARQIVCFLFGFSCIYKDADLCGTMRATRVWWVLPCVFSVRIAWAYIHECLLGKWWWEKSMVRAALCIYVYYLKKKMPFKHFNFLSKVPLPSSSLFTAQRNGVWAGIPQFHSSPNRYPHDAQKYPQ